MESAAAGELKCTPAIVAMLTNLESLKAKIKTLRAKQYDASHANDEDVAKQINALATELARLNTGPLQVKLTKTIAIQPEVNAGYVIWKQRHFRKWIEDPNNTTPHDPPSSSYTHLSPRRRSRCNSASGSQVRL